VESLSVCRYGKAWVACEGLISNRISTFNGKVQTVLPSDEICKRYIGGPMTAFRRRLIL